MRLTQANSGLGFEWPFTSQAMLLLKRERRGTVPFRTPQRRKRSLGIVSSMGLVRMGN
jgi:hypothetical protein